MSTISALVGGGFLRRVGAMIRKEFVQLRRDRVTFATIVTIPLMQLVLFGYAINTQPRGLPTAVLLQESSDVGRSILKALENTKYFKITRQVRDDAEFDRVLASGARCGGAISRRCWSPPMPPIRLQHRRRWAR